MRLLDRYVLWSILKVTLVTLALCTLMLVGVDLFTNLDSYLQNDVSWGQILRMSGLYIPQAMLIVIGPAALFSTTYFLSMLQANNEMISLLNAGIPYRRILAPCLILALLFSIGQFALNETFGIKCEVRREVLSDELFGQRSSYDNRNVTLSDVNGGFVIHAARYRAQERRIIDVVVVLRDDAGAIRGRVDASRGDWDEVLGSWVLKDATVYLLDRQGNEVSSYYTPVFDDIVIDVEPELFRNLSTDIKTMDLDTAVRYLRRMKYLEPSRWVVYSTEFWERVLGCVSPFILMLIACSINYRFKKNVLLFSIISSLCVAVVYYVVQMLTLILAKQGVIPPVFGMLIPMIVVFLLPLLESRLLLA
ncbi:MAG: LptF/LptG family permease [Sphaerochaetaceae bacterium]